MSKKKQLSLSNQVKEALAKEDNELKELKPRCVDRKIMCVNYERTTGKCKCLNCQFRNCTFFKDRRTLPNGLDLQNSLENYARIKRLKRALDSTGSDIYIKAYINK